MAVIYKTKCSICGGTLQYEEGQKTCLCEYCGALQSTADETKNYEVLLAEASIQLKRANFEKAAELYNEVLEIAPSCSKAYFGKMLCYFKLASPDELIHGVWPPIHRISENAFWQFAIQYANDNERREYDDLLKAHETSIEKERRRSAAQEKAQEKLEQEVCNKRIAEQRAAEESIADLVEAAKVRGKLFQLQNSIDEIEKQINEHIAYMDYETEQIQKYLPILKQWTIHFQPNRKASIKRTVEAAQARRVDHEFKCVSLRDRVKWLRNDYAAIAPSLTPNCHSIGALEAIDTMYEDGQYVVFAVADIGLDKWMPNYAGILLMPYSTIQDRKECIVDLQRLSVIRTKIDVLPEDQFLFLVTCEGNDYERRVISARRIRVDENVDDLQKIINTSYKK